MYTELWPTVGNRGGHIEARARFAVGFARAPFTRPYLSQKTYVFKNKRVNSNFENFHTKRTGGSAPGSCVPKSGDPRRGCWPVLAQCMQRKKERKPQMLHKTQHSLKQKQPQFNSFHPHPAHRGQSQRSSMTKPCGWDETLWSVAWMELS